MKQFFKWARLMGYIDTDPTMGIKLEKGAAKRTRYITREEEDRLTSEAVDWLQPIITFDVSTGLRRGELLALEKADVKLEERVVLVRDSKNGEPRVIPLSKRALEAVSRATSVTAKVFGGKGGEELQPANLKYNFRAAADRAGLKDLHFHDLRHTFATRMIQNGADIYAVQRLLGHKSMDQTSRYSHHSVESLRKVMEESILKMNGNNNKE